MITVNSFKKSLSRQGRNLAQIRKKQSDEIMNQTFADDPTYKRVYILTKDGWKFEDAKYQYHSAQSISKDEVDYYLQFRPKVHYPIGSYVIVPDDTDFEINLTEEELRNPFLQPINQRTQWWFIVGRDNANAFVRYNIIKCNWNFQWVWDGKVQSCFGAVRSANSYTSGEWRDEISTSLDNLAGAWLPDIHYVYGDRCAELGMDDNRTIMHKQRFMFSNNDLDPKTYHVSKVVDLSPQGVIKLSIKQDSFNENRDNVELRICDYYTDEGNNRVTEPAPEFTDENKTSSITWMALDVNGELIENISERYLTLGKTSYFKVDFSNKNVSPEWRIELFDPYHEQDEETTAYYEGLISLTKFDDSILALKPGKAKSLLGKGFNLCVCDENGDYHSSITVEVREG